MIEALVFPCTYRCDGKCIMCTIHKRKSVDIPWRDFEKFFVLPEMRHLKSINITGGEPTLRDDLVMLISMICQNCRELKEIIINTNGLNSKRIVKVINEVLETVPEQIHKWVYVSLDALDEKADKVRGVPNAKDKITDTIEELIKLKKAYGFELGVSFTATSENYLAISEVYNYAVTRDLYLNCILATLNTAYINSAESEKSFLLSSKQEEILINEVTQLSLKYSKLNFIPEQWLNKNGNYMHECIFREGRGLLLEADGHIRVCGMIDKCECGNLNNLPILQYNAESIPALEFCQGCKTDSYYHLTRGGQLEIKAALLSSIRNKRRSGSKNGVINNNTN